jgi:hypothetical protein
MADFLNVATGGTGANGLNSLTISVLVTKPWSNVTPDCNASPALEYVLCV